jgi:dethiobiotin synthetase
MSPQSDKLTIFMTATDTGVGKTTITAALTLALQKKGKWVGVMKPVETGIDPQRQEHSDTDRLRSLLSPPPPFGAICLYAFSQPLAPLACAREAGTIIDVSRIASSVHDLTQQYSFFFVEGVGGIFTPITTTHTIRDLMVALNFPALVIGRTSLGSVNHLLLSLEALQRAGIKTSGIVLNDSIPDTRNDSTRQQRTSTVELIRELSTVPVFGPLEFEERVRTNWRKGVETLAEHPEIQRLASHLIEMGP